MLKRGDVKLVLVVTLLVLLLSFGFGFASNFTNSSDGSNLTLNETIFPAVFDNATNETASEILDDSSVENITISPSDDTNESVEIAAAPTTAASFVIKDREGNEISHQLKHVKKTVVQKKLRKLKDSQEAVWTNETVEEDVFEVVPAKGPVKKIRFDADDVLTGSLSVDDVPESIPAPIGKWEAVYAIDPTALNFTNATVTVVAKGSSLYKCKEWDFVNQQCLGSWMFFKVVSPGKEYSFVLTPDDPGFGEILATAAVHMDANYTILEDIFNIIKTQDNVWSGPVYQGEIVRVRFAENLTNGRFIDVYVRSNDSSAYFDVYEAGTQNKVGSSSVVGGAELFFTEVNGLTQPTDTFDFKVQNNHPELNTTAFLEFDYIHDDVINTTTALGLIVYHERAAATPNPRYRLWNRTSAFETELSTNSIGKQNFTWVVTRANHERDELIAGVEDTALDVNIQIFNRTRGWQSTLEVATNVPTANTRAFDIAYEQVSGRALIVYENVTGAADSNVFFRLWNGTGYTAQQTLATSLTADNINWINLEPRSGSNEIMALIHTSTTNDLYAVLWNGTAFNTGKQQILSTGTASNTANHFKFGWQNGQGKGIAVYGVGAATIAMRRFNLSTTTAWSGETNIDAALTGALSGLRICSDPASDYVGMIYQDAANDVAVQMWNGSVILASPPTEDSNTEQGGTNNDNIDCTWYKDGSRAQFGFIDLNSLAVDYFNFTKPNTWSTTSLGTTSTTANFASDDIVGLRFTQHPTTNQIMAIAVDIVEDITAARWTGSSFVAVTPAVIETDNGIATFDAAQQAVSFDWYRYDTPPVVTGARPTAGTTISQNQKINISANVTDNIAVSRVRANVTKPGGAIVVLNLTLDGGNRYNITFSGTSATGTYLVRFIANDTSKHKNFNSTIRTNFTVIAADQTDPAVFDVRPRNASVFNVTNKVVVSANVTDASGVSQVFANITRPGALGLLRLQLKLSTENRYNNTFTIPNTTGLYNITFDANDTHDNHNTTIKTQFRANDRLKPTVFDIRPLNASIFNVTNKIVIRANVTDNVGVSQVFANITRPGGLGLLRLQLKLSTANRYNNTFTIPNTTGLYNITFDANDTSNNHNTSRRTQFRANDRMKPNVDNIRPLNASVFNITNKVRILANVTDNVAVSQVKANITRPGGLGLLQITLIKFGATNQYNNTFTIPNTTGFYNVTFDANDTSNNHNTTRRTQFRARDRTPPAVFDVRPFNASIFNITNKIVVRANVTDNIAVSQVKANITRPFGLGLIQITLKKDGASNKYNNTFTIPNATGLYNITFDANDTSNNHNTSRRTQFRANDNIKPTVFDVRPVNASVFNVTNKVRISANATNGIAISQVKANVTRPGGLGLLQITLKKDGASNRYNNTFTIPNITGFYNITFDANDTSNNHNTSRRTQFRANDRMKPVVFDIRPLNASTFNVTNKVLIRANVTDNIAVSQVFANITRPGGLGLLRLQLKLSTANRYNNTFTIPNVTGLYNITFDANDTSNNHNATVRTQFRANDRLKPNVDNIRPLNASVFNVTNKVRILANVTDNIAVSQVKANITRPGGLGLLQVTLKKFGATNQYNNTFTIPNITGFYNITFDANDTSNNHNATVRTQFRARDLIKPLVFDVRPLNASTFNFTQKILIKANVTDNVGVSQVKANITRPGGLGLLQITLKKDGSSNKYNNTFTVPNVTGFYNVTFDANDTSNNHNATVRRQFRAVDETPPAVFDVRPFNASVFNVTNKVVVSANVTDIAGVSQVKANVSRPGGLGLLQITLKKDGASDKYNNTFTIPNITGFYNITFDANDTSNNHNTSRRTQFRARDLVKPFVNNVRPLNGSVFNVTNKVRILANVTDNVAVSQVKANVTRPGGLGLTQVTLKRFGATNQYNNTFTIPNITGFYNITFDANDTSNNHNATVRTQFRARDLIKPNVDNIRPLNASVFNVTNKVRILANVTDNVGVSQVKANVTRPGGLGLLQVTLFKFGATNQYNNTFTIPNITGFYNITFDANDTSNNHNATRRTQFRAQDRLKPAVSSIEPTSTTVGVLTNFTANVTDNIGVTGCRLYINNALNGTMTVVGTAANRSVKFLSTGTRTLMANCTDAAGNYNDTSDTLVSVNAEVVRPLVFDVRPRRGSNYSVTNKIEVAANVTDNVGVSQVKANITRPGGVTVTRTLSLATGNKYNVSFTIPNITGRYNVTFLANDTSNNKNFTVKTYFFVNDSTRPAVFDVRPLNGSVFNTTSKILIKANVTDNVAVSQVKANVTRPFGLGLVQITLIRFGSSNQYNNTFTIPNATGFYNITFDANDTSNRHNVSRRTQFRANDRTRPVVFDVRPFNASLFNITSKIVVSANVTNSIAVSQVKANITRPGGLGLLQITLKKDGASSKYNNTFTIPNATGFYNITFDANDTSNNHNATVETQFRARDVFKPNVDNIRPLNASIFNVTNKVRILANVTDTIAVSQVKANVSRPGGLGLTQVTLKRFGATNQYNNTFTVPNVTGLYNITFDANDTSNNHNATRRTQFRANDRLKPNVDNIRPLNASVFNVTNKVRILANVTDNIAVSQVKANVTRPGGLGLLQVTLKKFGATNQYNNTFTIPNITGFYNITFDANDTSNNHNATRRTQFRANDRMRPIVFDVRPFNASIFNVTNKIVVSANVTDNVAVSQVKANITRPGGLGLLQITLKKDGASDKYNNTFTIPNATGIYNVTFDANDTSNNHNATRRVKFRANDRLKPNVDNIRPLNGSVFNTTNKVRILANVTDNVAVSQVKANVTRPGGLGLLQVTLKKFGATNQYNNTFTVPNVTGFYNITFDANDTSNNHNTSRRTQFRANDTIKPAVSTITPTSATTSNLTRFIANVTDNVAVASCRLYVNNVLNGTMTVVGTAANRSVVFPTTGTRTLLANCTDTSGNYNDTSDTLVAVVSEAVRPLVFDVRPRRGSNFSVANKIEVSANVTDNVAVSQVFANITRPHNLGLITKTLTLATGNKYNVSFTIPNVTGRYNVTFFANDSSNNKNSTVKTFFNVNDSTRPKVFDVRPRAGFTLNNSKQLEIAANVTDNVNVSQVKANITRPGGLGLVTRTLTLATGNKYNISFIAPNVTGRYNVTFFANDTSNRKNATVRTFFRINDTIAPSVVLNAPRNGFNSSSTTVIVNITTADNFYPTVNCVLRVDSVVRGNDTAVLSGSLKSFTVSSLSQGNHFWNATCIDGTRNKNASVTRKFTVDTGTPIFISLITVPSSIDDLDPNSTIRATANVTDNITGVHTVIFQRKLTTESNFVNVTMTRNATRPELYFVSFNVSKPGTYNLRLRANDTANNFATSNVINRTIEFDRTWIRTPSSFTPISTTLNTNVTLGNLTINNTGDFIMNFSIVSSSNKTRLSGSANFSLAAKATRRIKVNDTANVVGVKTVTLNISATPNGTPRSQITTGSIVAVAGQPILVATFLNPSGDTLSVTRGQTNIEFTAMLKNIGQSNATNVTLSFRRIPSDWVVTLGTLNKTEEYLSPGDNISNTIEVTILSNASTGVRRVTSNGTGFNSTGTSVTSLGLSFGDLVDVTVNAPQGPLGGGGGGGGTPPGGSASGGGGGGGVSQVPFGELLVTESVLSALRGAIEGTPVFLRNLFENAVLEGVHFEVEGLLSQYVTITPIFDPNKLVFVDTRTAVFNQIGQIITFSFASIGEHTITLNQVGADFAVVTIASTPQQVRARLGEFTNVDLDGDGAFDVAVELRSITGITADVRIYLLGHPDPDKIYFLEERQYEFELFAPPYLTTQDINLTVRILADIVATDPAKAGFERKQLVQTRIVTFRVTGIAPSQVFAAIDQAKAEIQRAAEAGFSVVSLTEQINTAEQTALSENYEKAFAIAQNVILQAQAAFEADALIKELEQGIQSAKLKMLTTIETEKALELTKKAFEREDYLTALKRAKETQLTLFLETKGRVNILWFIRTYWLALLAGSLVAYVIVLWAYKRTAVMMINRRLIELTKEEQSIDVLIRATQERHFKKKQLSDEEYHRIISQNQKRLDEIIRSKIKSRNKRISLLQTAQALADVKKEEVEMTAAMKKAQEEYFRGKGLARDRFEQMYSSEKKRVVELQKEEEELKEKLEKEEKTKGYKALKLLDDVLSKIGIKRGKNK
jgi:hypothetical protein